MVFEKAAEQRKCPVPSGYVAGRKDHGGADCPVAICARRRRGRRDSVNGRWILVQLTDSASEAWDAARAAGLEPAGLGEVQIEVREGAQGAEPVLTTILIGIAVKAGSTVAERLWREVVWPQLRRRLGTRVLGDRQDGLARSA